MRASIEDFSRTLNTDRLRAVKRHLELLSPGWMLLAGLAVGMSVGLAALFGIGGWTGLGVCLLPLGVAVWLSAGAEPVMRHPAELRKPEAPEIPVEPEPEAPAPAEELQQETEPKIKTIWVIEDIPNLLEMIELPGGTFMMGSAEREVTVSDFCLGRHPVTRALYREIMDESSSRWSRDTDDGTLPATYQSWFDAVKFCNALSQHQGLQPCYGINDKQVTWDRDGNGYRLPTEAEWEYAVRAGTTTRWFCGDDEAELERYAWFNKNSGDRVHPVGEKEPNPWGFHDMAGNVWEWCWDWYGDYAAAPLIDPVGPDGGEYRVLRGGAYWGKAGDLRSADRVRVEPRAWGVGRGFRIAHAPRRQP